MSEMLKLFHSYPDIRKLYSCGLGMSEHYLHTSSYLGQKGKCLQLYPDIRS